MEMNVIRRTAYLRAFNANINSILLKLIVVLTVVFYSLSGKSLESDKAMRYFLFLKSVISRRFIKNLAKFTVIYLIVIYKKLKFDRKLEKTILLFSYYLISLSNLIFLILYI